MSSINLPLILSLAVLVTGLIWLFDILVLAPPRKRRQEAIARQYEGANLDKAAEHKAYSEAMEAAGKEPSLVEYAKSFFPVLLVVFVLRSFLAEPFQIPSGSMEPTLDVGDFIVVNKFTYGIRLPVINKEIIPVNEPERGDVMVFFPPHMPDTYFIKRVIGLPGDKVSYIDHQLTINGEPVEEELIARLPKGDPEYRLVEETLNGKDYLVKKNLAPGRYSRYGVWEVPEGHYFMMGDNRDSSFDSRGWNDLNEGSGPNLAFVPEDEIVGKAVAVWMHWHPLFSLPSFDSAGKIQ